MRVLAPVAIIFALAGTANAGQVIEGTVTKVRDVDTIEVAPISVQDADLLLKCLASFDRGL